MKNNHRTLTQLPVGGQFVSNAKNNIAFMVSYAPESRILSFEGRRDAAKVETFLCFVEDQTASLVRLEEALVSLIENTPRRR